MYLSLCRTLFSTDTNHLQAHLLEAFIMWLNNGNTVNKNELMQTIFSDK